MTDDFKFKPVPAKAMPPAAPPTPAPQPVQYVQQPQVVYVQQVVAPPRKSVGAAFALTFFFGPLGAFYVSSMGALLWILGSVVAAIFTFGFSILITWPACIIWACAATSASNQKRDALLGVGR